MSSRWALLSLLLCCSCWLPPCLANCPGRYVRSPAGQLFRLIPVRLYVPEQLEEDVELLRQPRQQQFVQEVVVENNFGGPGGNFAGPPFGGPQFGGPQFGGPPFGGPGFGRGGFGRGGGFGGSFGGGFGGSFGGGGFGRSYDSEEEQPQHQQPTPAPSVPAPPCANNYVFSCEAVIKPVPCAAPDPPECGY